MARGVGWPGEWGNTIVCEETEILEKATPRILEVTQTVAKFLCDYVKRGHFGG